MHDLSPFVLGMIAGGMVSIPLGPFGFWALQLYIREGKYGAFTIALGGALGDLVVAGGYIFLSWVEATVGQALHSFFSSGIVHGIALTVVGLFFLQVARSEGKGRSFPYGTFWAPFLGSFTIQNVLVVGVVLTGMGISASMAEKFLWHLVPAFFFGSIFTWILFVIVLSHVEILRRYLARILRVCGWIWCLMGAGLVLLNGWPLVLHYFT